MVRDAQADAIINASQESIEKSASVAKPPPLTIKGQAGYERELDLVQRDNRKDRVWLEHTEGVPDQTPRVVRVEDHAALAQDARQEPALVRVAFQQRAQVHFAAHGHVGQDGFGRSKERPGFDVEADCGAGLTLEFLAEGFAHLPALRP